MDENKKRKTLKSVPFLKGRTDKSIEKTADSFLDLSSKLFAAVFLSVVVIPLSALFKNMFSGNTSPSFTLNDLEVFISANGAVLGLVCFIAIFWAWRFRKIALNLYDALES